MSSTSSIYDGKERSFGLSVGGACLALAALWAWRRTPTLPLIFSLIGAVLVILGLLAPTLLRVPNRLWWRLAHVLGWINSRILMTVIFFLILTPVGVIRRLGGADSLRLKTAGRGSGWLPYPERFRNPHHYERMY